MRVVNSLNCLHIFAGTNSLAVNFVSAVIGGFIAPALFALFGFRPVMLLTNFIYVLYIIANLHPRMYFDNLSLFDFPQFVVEKTTPANLN